MLDTLFERYVRVEHIVKHTTTAEVLSPTCANDASAAAAAGQLTKPCIPSTAAARQ